MSRKGSVWCTMGKSRYTHSWVCRFSKWTEKVLQGITTFEEIYKLVEIEDELDMKIQEEKKLTIKSSDIPTDTVEEVKEEK